VWKAEWVVFVTVQASRRLTEALPGLRGHANGSGVIMGPPGGASIVSKEGEVLSNRLKDDRLTEALCSHHQANSLPLPPKTKRIAHRSRSATSCQGWGSGPHPQPGWMDGVDVCMDEAV